MESISHTVENISLLLRYLDSLLLLSVSSPAEDFPRDLVANGGKDVFVMIEVRVCVLLKKCHKVLLFLERRYWCL